MNAWPRAVTLLAAMVLVAAACSGSGSDSDNDLAASETTELLADAPGAAVTPSSADGSRAPASAVVDENLRAVAGRFLRGEVSVAEVAEVARLPQVAEDVFATTRYQRSWIFAYGKESFDSVAQYAWAERVHDEELRERDFVELPLERLADTQAAIFVLADRLDLKESLVSLYEPEWLSRSWYERGRPFQEYGNSLSEALWNYEWPLFIRQLQELYWLYDEVHCLEGLGIVTDGLLQQGFEEAAAMVAAGEPSSVTHTGMAARLFKLSGAPSEMRVPYGKCLLRYDERLWPLPYDPQEAFELLRGDVLTYLQQWAEENRDLQPEGLTVVLPQG